MGTVRWMNVQFKRLTIKNVQSIEDMELNFDERACHHIMGDNNIGKSTIMKCINMLANNVSSRQVKYFIRDYKEYLYIESEDHDGNTVALCRGKEDYYKWNINGKEGFLPDAKKDVPKEIKEYFNFYTDEKTKENLNIRLADDRLPFVQMTPGENYYIFQKALRIEEYLKAIKLGNEKRRETKKAIGFKDERLEETQESLDGVPDYRPLVKDIEIYENAADEMVGRMEIVEKTISLGKAIERKREELDRKSFDYAEEHVEGLIEKIRMINDLVRSRQAYDRKKMRLEREKETVALFEDAEGNVERYRELYEMRNLFEDHQRLKMKVDVAEKRLDEYSELVRSFDEMGVGELVEKVSVGRDVVGAGKDLRVRSKDVREEKELLRDLEQDKKTFMKEEKLCPVVLEMDDNKCPFSGDTIEQLMKSGG